MFDAKREKQLICKCTHGFIKPTYLLPVKAKFPLFLNLQHCYILKSMGLSKEAIEEFKKTYSQEFEEDISDEKAKELGENLLELFKIIYRPITPKNKSKKSCL